MEAEQREAILDLIDRQRWAALATLSENGPDATWVAYAAIDRGRQLILHLSRLAHHTRNIERQPLVSLSISEQDDGRDEPQSLARLSLSGELRPVGREAADWPALRDLYLHRLPAAAPRFDFADFALYRLTPQRGWWVGGFGQARRFPARDLWPGQS